MDRRVNKALHYFDNIGLQTLTGKEEPAIVRDYRAEMRRGVGRRAQDSSLRMIDTLLVRSKQALKPGTGAVVVEVGGTNFRVYGFRVNADGELKPEYGRENRMQTVKFPSAEAFFSYSADQVKAAMGDGKRPDALALIYSYPAEAMKVSIPGISHAPVGLALVDKLVSEGVLEDRIPLLVLNDTPAVLLGHPNSKIGAVVGAGFNMAVDWNGVIRNTESGGFNKLPVPNYVRSHDQNSENPGKQLAEKQIAGKYVGEQFNSIVRTLINSGIVQDLGTRRPLTGRDISSLLSSDIPSGFSRADKEDLDILREAAWRLSSRSARIFGLMAGAALKNVEPKIDQGVIVDVPVEGSFFWGAEVNKRIAMETASSIGGRQVTFSRGSGVRGAADAALRLVA